MKHNRLEHGQSLVLIILAIVGMLGFAALAVDGGRLLAERRRAQSAADSAALAAAFADSASGKVAFEDPLGEDSFLYAAKQSLTSNGFDPTSLEVKINKPPDSGPYSSLPGYYQVKIHAVVDKVFSQFIFPGNLEYQVEAVAYLEESKGIAPNMGLVANGEGTCQGIVWDGGTNTTILHGSIFSNSLGTAAHGGSNCYSGITNGSPGKIVVPDGEIGMVASWRNNAGSTVVSSTGTGASAVSSPVEHIDFEFPEPPDCSNLAWTTPDNSTHILPAGRHRSVTLRGNDDWTMATGMHCFYGDFVVGTKSLTALPGQGVFIAMMPAIPGEREGGIAFSGGTTFDLNYMADYTDAAGQQWGGMLIYMPWDNDNGIDIQGNTGTFYSGTILAPGPRTPSSQPKCDIGGTNQTISMNSSVICYDIGIAGNSTLNISYDPGANWSDSPDLSLTQ